MLMSDGTKKNEGEEEGGYRSPIRSSFTPATVNVVRSR